MLLPKTQFSGSAPIRGGERRRVREVLLHVYRFVYWPSNEVTFNDSTLTRPFPSTSFSYRPRTVHGLQSTLNWRASQSVRREGNRASLRKRIISSCLPLAANSRPRCRWGPVPCYQCLLNEQLLGKGKWAHTRAREGATHQVPLALCVCVCGNDIQRQNGGSRRRIDVPSMNPFACHGSGGRGRKRARARECTIVEFCVLVIGKLTTRISILMSATRRRKAAVGYKLIMII